MFQDWRNCYCNPPGCQYFNFEEGEVVPDCKSLGPVAENGQFILHVAGQQSPR